MSDYRWRKGDRFRKESSMWYVLKVSDDGQRAILQSESTEWARTRELTFNEWDEAGRSGFTLICERCDGTGVICIAAGGNPDAAEDVPCPRCGQEREEDPRTAEEMRDAATFAETHGGEL